MKRLLELNCALISCLKLKLEMAKIPHADHLWKKKDPSSYTLRMVDMRFLVSVSSIVAVVEDVLKDLNRVDRDHASSKVRLNFFILWNQKRCWHQK